MGQPSADRDYLPGHERMQALLSGIRQHRPRLRIRIAGTNGKGSTAFMLAAALQSAGLTVGLYTSPHILCFNERIRIQGEPVSDALLLAAMQRLMPAALDAGASYFETATALALDLFAVAGVDVEILEAGVGARLDATTAVPADMALITPIGLDHQAWLGDTVAAVASEKAFVMQGCRWSTSAPQTEAVVAVLDAFNPLVKYCDILHWRELAVAGVHQQINASLAYAAAEQLQEMLPEMDMDIAREAIAACHVPGRLQPVQVGGARVWLDAAHNRHAIEALLPGLSALADPFDAILVFTREDRSLEQELALLAPYAREIVHSRGETDTALRALRQVIEHYPHGSFLVLGSFITVAAILRAAD
ncbi:bifunctional folylpolyglutamate synthase/dihydrofolate synthase [Mariprofundus ferrooxydans]|uniref:bifunctional folylpolyglutamate synthase/dihydrofolate synthase n=1 Tax=Mariprofundus ferrooxydans TaxID=314344 RepID=UPI0003747590|nr:cyanophycin synthetase [Mariprofundus ferrooxydans]